jgi:hypothetical protein
MSCDQKLKADKAFFYKPLVGTITPFVGNYIIVV